ncbi:MAG: 3-oxoadipate enol-lactonase [Gaiellaceae bacterium]
MSALGHRLQGPEDGPLLVLPGSLGTTVAIWEPQLDALAGFRLLLCDLRGHGTSEVPPGPYSVRQLGQDLLDLLDELRLDRVSLCGLSLGGAVGIWLAAERPERIERLVLACTSARFASDDRYRRRAATVRESGIASIAESVIERWFTPAFRARRPDVVAAYRERLLATPVEGYAASCEAIADWDFHERLGEIRTPTLVLAAEGDEATPPEHAELLASGIPGARLQLLPQAAHQANAEQPERFARLVSEHLAGTPRSGAEAA